MAPRVGGIVNGGRDCAPSSIRHALCLAFPALFREPKERERPWFMSKKSLIILVVVVSVLSSLGCSSGGTVLGPFPVSLPLEGGVIDPLAFGQLPAGLVGTTSVRQDFCGMPTEAELEAQMPSIGSIDISGFAKLEAIDIVSATLTASQGDFSFIREIVISFIPKPVDGVEQAPIEIGRASSDSGFGSSMVLVPSENVDFLELVRANDDNPADGCPQIEFTVTGTVPTQEVVWSGVADAEVYVRIGG